MGQGHFTKEDTRMANKHAPHHMSSGKCKLKQWIISTHLLGGLKSGKLTTPNVDKNGEQQELSFITGGRANATAI